MDVKHQHPLIIKAKKLNFLVTLTNKKIVKIKIVFYFCICNKVVNSYLYWMNKNSKWSFSVIKCKIIFIKMIFFMNLSKRFFHF